MSVDKMIELLHDQDKSQDNLMDTFEVQAIIAALRAGEALAHAVYSGDGDRIAEAMTNYMKGIHEREILRCE